LDVMGKTVGYVRLMRPINSAMMGFAVLVGATLASPDLPHILRTNLLHGFVTGFVLTASSMTINDHYDKEIDAINEPTRPIPSGLIKSEEALVCAFALTAIGFASAYLTSIFCFAVAVLAWLVFVTYTAVGKRRGLLGNLMVSICVTIPFIYGSLVVTNDVKSNVLLFATTVFLSNTGREITKGIADVAGDKAQNVNTLAVRYGERDAAIAAAIFYLIAVSISPLPWTLGLVSFWYVPLVALTDLGLIAYSIKLLRDYSRDNARRTKNGILLWFATGLLAYFAGAFG